MRDMFNMHYHGKAESAPPKYTMWFDDDSWILPDAPQNWFDSVSAAMEDADMIGSIWRMRSGFIGAQPEFIRNQPWYAGKPVRLGMRTPFVTGGWWTIRTEILQRWDWPPDVRFHNGGDMMLGELCRQQGYRLRQFTTGLGINTKDRKCSTAPRRGFSEKMLGYDYPFGDRWSTPASTTRIPVKLPEEGLVNWLDVLEGE
jgi:hypothetical protein